MKHLTRISRVPAKAQVPPTDFEIKTQFILSILTDFILPVLQLFNPPATGDETGV